MVGLVLQVTIMTVPLIPLQVRTASPETSPAIRVPLTTLRVETAP